MHQNIKYTNHLDIVFLFRTKENVADFFNFLILITQKLSNENEQKTFISPIVYIKNAFVFNIDYNYLVQSIATWSGIDQIYEDFKIDDIDNEKNQYTHQMFLIKGLFEYVYGLVWLRDSIDTSKYSGKIVKLQPRFCNMLVLKKQNCFAQFFAVPFSKSALKSLLSRETYLALLKLSKYRYVQLAFGHKQYSTLDLTVRKKLTKFKFRELVPESVSSRSKKTKKGFCVFSSLLFYKNLNAFVTRNEPTFISLPYSLKHPQYILQL